MYIENMQDLSEAILSNLISTIFLWTQIELIGTIVLKFIYFEKATKFCEVSTLLLSYVVLVKSKVEILQNFVAFSEYMNFTCTVCIALA